MRFSGSREVETGVIVTPYPPRQCSCGTAGCGAHMTQAQLDQAGRLSDEAERRHDQAEGRR